MAGLLFTDKNVVLAGYKPYCNHITGIGGKPQKNETLLQTAFRETVEELVGVFDSCVVPELEAKIVPFTSVENSGYTHFLCSMDDLVVFLEIVSVYPSKFYNRSPRTLEDLILKRKIIKGAEIAQLAVIPFVPDVHIARHLSSDLTLCAMLVSRK